MKVFIAGSYNAFTNELIKKFHKENDKVYVLTGEQSHGNKPHNEHMIRISNGRICVVNPCTICPV